MSKSSLKPFVAPEEAEVPPVMSLSSKVASWVMKAPRGKKNVWTKKVDALEAGGGASKWQ